MKVEQVTKLERFASLVGELSLKINTLSVEWDELANSENEEFTNFLDKVYPINMSCEDLAICFQEWKENFNTELMRTKLIIEAQAQDAAGQDARVVLREMEEMIVKLKDKHNLW